MDFTFEPAVLKRIKSVRARAFAMAITEGHSAETARKSADKISRAYWRDRLREAEAKKHIRASTLRRILTKEGNPDMTKTGDVIIDRQLKSAKAKAVAAVDMDLFNAGLPNVEQVQAMTKSLADLQKEVDVLKARPATVKVIDPPKPATAKATQAVPTKAQVLGLAAYAEMRRHAHQAPVADTIRAIAPADNQRLLRKWSTKAATYTANTTSAGWAQELNTIGLAPLWTEMADDSLLRLMLDAGVRTSAMGDASAITVPIDQSELQANWVGENSTIPVSEGSLTSTSINRSKLAVISTCSNELLKTADPNILDIITRNALEAIDSAASRKLLSSDAAIAGVAPAGLLGDLNTQASAGGTLDNIKTDIKFLLANLVKARRPVICINPLNVAYLSMITESGVAIFAAELAQGRLYGIPLLQTHQVPVDQMFAFDLDRLMIWPNGSPEIDVSSSATLVMADGSAPAPVMGDGSGHVGTGDSIQISDAAASGAEVRSMYQTYSTASRIIQPVSWGWVKALGAYLTGVGYGS